MPRVAHPNDAIKWAINNYQDRLVEGGGEYTNDKTAISNESVTMPTGTIRFRWFTAMATESITRIRTISGGTAAAATPTLCRVGIYSVDPTTGNLALLVACASDTALWAATNTAYTSTLTSTFSKIAGTRYAFAMLCVSGVATPTMQGGPPLGMFNGSVGISLPQTSGIRTGRTDLDAAITAASISQNTFLDATPTALLLP